METKFDFKKEAKKAYDTTVRLLKPLRNLDKNVVSGNFEPFLKKHIQMVYVVGCAILLLFAVFALRFFPAMSIIFGHWVILVVIFVFFRLLCEIIASKK